MRYCVYRLGGEVVGWRCSPDTEERPPDIPRGWTFQYRSTLEGIRVVSLVDVDSELRKERMISMEEKRLLRKMARESLGLPPEDQPVRKVASDG